MDLVKLIMQQLAIDESQAKGGLGLIFDLVKQKLNSQEYQQVSKLVPNVDDLIKTVAKSSAPKGGGLLDVVGSLASQLTGKDLSSLGSLAELVAGFEKLGLKPEMIARFIPVVMKFIEDKGGVAVRDLLNKVLRERGAQRG